MFVETLSPLGSWLNPRLFCAKFCWNWPAGSGEYFLQIVNFPVIYPWEKPWPFIWTNLNSLYPRVLCARFGWNWPIGSEEEDRNVNSSDRRTYLLYDVPQANRKSHLIFQLRWARTTEDKLWQYKIQEGIICWSCIRGALVSNGR